MQAPRPALLAGRRPLAPAAIIVLGLLGACSYFPSHEDVFKPVAVTIGTPQVVGTDTVWRVDGRGYALTSPRRDVLPDVVDGLENTRREWRRYFTDDPPAVDMRLMLVDPALRRNREGEGRGGERRPEITPASNPPRGDSSRTEADSARPERRRLERGDSGVVRLMVMVSKDRRNETVSLGGQNASRVAQAWLAAATRQWRSASTGDSAQQAGVVTDWAEDAIGALIVPSSRGQMLLAALANKPADLLPLSTLFTTHRPPGEARMVASTGDRGGMEGGGDGDEGFPMGGREGGMGGGRGGYGGREGGRGGARGTMELPPSLRFSAEAYAVAEYLSEKENPVFVGHLIEMTARGQSVEQALADARAVPTDLPGLEKDFKAWLSTHRAEQRQGRDRGGMGPMRLAGGQS